ncbi:hypothetical protein [Dactylosporangium sp. NPDC051541]|uniref:hypothetical protein n=1 Tax=Dactylosporangium sp. NPDC051541 TaxID=3363977 RepID=UPI00379BE08D
MARPTDWDKVGLGSDPTPGDPGRIDEVIASIRELGSVAREVDDGLAAVLETAGPNAFVGQTADALREKISGRLRGFVQSLAEAFEWSVTALTNYNTTLRDQQWRADNALTQARPMADDDPGKQSLTDTANNAKTAVSDAASTASNRIVEAYENIKQPVSGCEEFWEIFKWIAIALILPALVFGGPIALVALGVNMVLFIKTAVDFAQGKASALEFFLSALGILAPTTRAVPIFQLIKTGAQLAWNGLKAGAFAVFKFFGNTFKNIVSHPFVLFPGLHDMVALSGSWVKGAGLWVQAGIKDLPAFMATTLSKGGLFVVNGVKGIGNVLAGTPGFIAKFANGTWAFLQREFGGNKWLRLFLPAEADELRLGVWNATKLAVWDRGVLGKHIFGLPKPHPVLPEQQITGSAVKFAEMRAGDLAVPPRLQMPKLTDFGGLGHLGQNMSPPSMHIPTTFGDSMHFSGDAVRQLDALMLSPMDTISKVRIEAWADRSMSPVLNNVDHITGISSAVHLQPPAVTHLAGNNAISSTVHALDLPNLHVPAMANGATHTSTLHALDLPNIHVNSLVTTTPHLGATPASVHAVETLGSAAVTPPALHLMNGAPTSALHGAGSRILDHTGMAISAQHVSLDLGSVTRHVEAPPVNLQAPVVNAIVTPPPVSHLATSAPPPTSVTHIAATTPPPVTHLVSTPPAAIHTIDNAAHIVATPPPAAIHSIDNAAIHSVETTSFRAVDTASTTTAAHVVATPPPVHVNLAPVERTPTIGAGHIETVAHPAPAHPSTAHAVPTPNVHSGNVNPAHSAGAPKVDDLVVAVPAANGTRTFEKAPAVNPAHSAGTDVHTAAIDPNAIVATGLVHSPAGARGFQGGGDLVHGAGRPGKTVSLPAGGLEAAWRRDSDRLGELFGGADDPLRAKKIDTWAQYTRARNELGRIEQTWNDLMDRPGGSSKGPTAVEVRAERTYAAAIARVDRIARDLKSLGIDPVTMDLRIAELTAQSIKARPRLVGGGAVHSQPVAEAFDPHVPLRNLDGSPSNLRVEIQITGNGTETYRVVDAQDAVVPRYTAAAHGDLGFQITDTLNGNEFRRYDDAGTVLADGRPVPGHADWYRVEPRGHPPHLEVPNGFQVTPHGGAFQVDDLANAGHFERFDLQGNPTATGRPVAGHNGWSHLTDAAGGRHLEVPAGFQAGPYAGGGFHVDDLTNAGHFERFDVNGNLTHTGRPVPGHNGWSHLTDQGGGTHLEVPPGFQVNPHPGGGAAFQVDNLTNAGHFERFDAAGNLTHTGQPIAGHNGWSHVTDQAGATHLEVPAGFQVHARPGGNGFQVDNLTNRAHFERFDNAGVLTHTGVRANDLTGTPDRFLVHTTGGGWHAERPGGAAIPHLRVQRTPAGDFRVTDTRGLHHGEYRVHNPDGVLRHQAFNVIRDGQATTRQFVVDVPGGRWTMHDAGAAVANPGHFQRGAADFTGAANGRIKLLTDTGAEMFNRRVIPGTAQTLDTFRTVGGAKWGGSRPQWAKFDQAGAIVDHGVRHFDNSAVQWRDVSHTGDPSHTIRTSLGGGEIIATRGAMGRWTWHRVDADGNSLANGVRTVHNDGGWTDRMAGAGGGRGPIAQQQYGPWHGPDKSGMYKEFDLAGGAPAATWKSQSPHGKDAGKVQNLQGGGTLETARWSEQRPPHWARRFLAGVPDGVFRAHGNQFLRNDTKFQLFTTTKIDGAGVRTDGFRFVSMSDATYDVGANGAFLRYTGKLDHGNTLNVGHDIVALPPVAAPVAGRTPWSEGAGKLSGWREHFPAGRADGKVWEDRFYDTVPANGDWYSAGAGGANVRVARAGFTDGSIREFHRPPAVPAAGAAADGSRGFRADAFEGPGHGWTQRNIHGVVIGRSDEFANHAPGANANFHVEARGGADTRRWTWTDGAGNTGTRDWGRGFNGPHTTFDDSFRDFDTVNGVQTLVRERRMLDGGAYVDAWRVDNAAGGHHWEWRRIDKFGNVHAPGGATREWFNPRPPGGGPGAFQPEWFPGAARFQDVTTVPGGAQTLIRDIPPTSIGDIARVREYNGGNRGVWKEFDMGSVVRERKPRPGGGFIEKDAWRGQWRQYDNAGAIIARRDDAGWVEVPGVGRGYDLAGRELDYRGWASEIRGFNRRIRESNRMEWGGQTGGMFNEALYKPYWQHALEKIAWEFAQEFLLEFTANLIVNAIIDAIAGKQFSGQDALKALTNAAVGSTVKSAVGGLMHENRFGGMQRTADLKAGLANIDGGKHWFRKPMNHDKHWSNEWAGNETATRWRGGTYDFAFNIPVAGLSGFANGAINAAVFGFTNANGETVKVAGGAAAFDGLIGMASGITGAVTTTIGKTLFNSGLGGRAFHRQGLAEFGFQLPWKIAEKLVTSELTKAFRASINPWYYQAGGGK